MNMPEDDRVNVDRNSVLCQRLFGIECGCLYAAAAGFTILAGVI
jgi:hypothetical protein